ATPHHHPQDPGGARAGHDAGGPGRGGAKMKDEMKDDTGGDEGRIPGLSALRDITPPPSLVPAVMRRIAEPAAVGGWPALWGWLRRSSKLERPLSPLEAAGDRGPIPGLSALRDTTPPPSLVPAAMRRIAEP